VHRRTLKATTQTALASARTSKLISHLRPHRRFQLNLTPVQAFLQLLPDVKVGLLKILPAAMLRLALFPVLVRLQIVVIVVLPVRILTLSTNAAFRQARVSTIIHRITRLRLRVQREMLVTHTDRMFP
jgi:hypothetical protein